MSHRRCSASFLYLLAASVFTAAMLHVSAALAQTDIILNGSFEDDFAHWTQITLAGSGTSTISTGSQCGAFHTSKAASFNVFGNKKFAIEQDVVIPGNSTAQLKFKVWGQLQDTKVTVKVLFQGGQSATLDNFTAIPLIASYSFPGPIFVCTSNTFETKSYDLSSYTGQAITVHFDATSSGFDGTFALIDDVQLIATPGGTVPPTDPNSGGKRATAIQLFCNRSGPNLETAKCSATVADKGTRPLVLPTGEVDFTASSGFFPAFGSCLLQQTPLSPGISSCEVDFTIPTGFPIGVKFPIDAAYLGNNSFESSSTSHNIISPGCVSLDPAKPCPNSIGLSFGEFPTFKKGKFVLTIGCGSKDSNPNVSGEGIPGGVCKSTLHANVNIRQLLNEFTYGDWLALSAQITEKIAKGDAFSRVALELGRLTPTKFATLKASSAALDALAKDIAANKLRKPAKNGKTLDPYFKIALGASGHVYLLKAKANGKAALITSTVESTIKADALKDVSLKLTARINKIAALLKKVNLFLPLDVTVSVKQKNRKGIAKITQSVDVMP